MTIKEIAEHYNVRFQTVYKWIHRLNNPNYLGRLKNEEAAVFTEREIIEIVKVSLKYRDSENTYRIQGDTAIIYIKGFEAKIDKEDLSRVIKHSHWTIGTQFLEVLSSRKDGTKLHRFVMNCPENMVVDHISGDRLDNRKINLRICTQAENMRNQKLSKRNSSGYKGVVLEKRTGKWVAQIVVNKKRIHLGTFVSREEAHKAYCDASKKYHGEFGRVA